jgi:hypothetical protein
VGFRDVWATTLNGVLERGRRKSTQPRVFGIPVAGVPGRSQRPTVAIPPERATGCASCGRTPRPGENADDDWRVESDDVGGLHVVCPECWQREFGAGDGSDRTGEGRCDG